ncbi:hypothetical protein CCACVL1_01989 [Corchorus capsularis]|uniref:Uncharacterized protein n=1 Tax=Corchorus capsularis TaxID=210143 RepID=A0A1R3KDS2_COCAP|nr:hypothetical protein CCACVL1_01989 [Corchorus capsularis]
MDGKKQIEVSLRSQSLLWKAEGST